MRSAFYAVLARYDANVAQDRAFLARTAPLRVLVMGDSQPFMGVEATQLGEAANVSALGEGYMLNYWRLDRYLRKRPDLCDGVVLGVNMHSFSSGWGQFTASFSRGRFVNYLELARVRGDCAGVLGEYFRYRGAPYAGALSTLAPHLSPKPRLMGIANWYRAFALTTAKPARAARRAEEHYGGQVWPAKTQEDYLRALLDLCRTRGIRPVLVRYPVTREYQEAAQSYVDAEAYEAIVRGVLADYPEALFLDYATTFEQTPLVFGDADHLNALGRRHFTAMLRADLEKAGLLSASTGP